MLGYFTFSPHLKTERDPGIWFSLSYHSFSLLERSAGAEALEAAIFSSVAVRCTAHISQGYLGRDSLLHKAHRYRDLSVSRTSAPFAAAYTSTPWNFEPGNTQREGVWEDNDKHYTKYIVLVSLLFFTPSGTTFLLIGGTNITRCFVKVQTRVCSCC